MTAATIVPSPLAGEGGSRMLTDEGVVAVGSTAENFCAVKTPSSDASRHLLPQGEKGSNNARHRLRNCETNVSRAQRSATLKRCMH